MAQQARIVPLPFGAPLPPGLAPSLHFHGGRQGALYLRELIAALAEPGVIVLESLRPADRARVERLLASLDESGRGTATLLGPDGYGQVEEPVVAHPEAEVVFVERTLAQERPAVGGPGSGLEP